MNSSRPLPAASVYRRQQRASSAGFRFVSGLGSMRGIMGLLCCMVLWEAVARLGLLNKLFFASISQIAVAAWQMYASGEIFEHLAYTLTNFVLGFSIGIALGVPLGLLLGWRRNMREYFEPAISFALATPVIVLVPLIISTFGIYWPSKVAITAWSVFFPVLVSMIAGVQGVDETLVKVARSFQAGDLKIIRDIVLPNSVPTLVSGLRLGLARGLVGELAAEFFGAPRGLGFLAFNYSTTFQPARMFVAIITMAIIAMLLTTGMQRLQRYFDAWRSDLR